MAKADPNRMTNKHRTALIHAGINNMPDGGEGSATRGRQSESPGGRRH